MTKVLIAEDNLTLLEDIVLELELRGYEVIPATDGQSALDILRTMSQPPDIIVSDIAMPNIDGYKLLEHLRSDPSWNGIPFLFLTAFDSQNSIRISKELGVDDYIVKPFQAEDLVLAMENKLKRIASFQKQAERSVDTARQTLLHMISHELRTPLTAIYGGSAILEEVLSGMPDQSIRDIVNLIQNGANRLNRFTEKALSLLQIDSGYLEKTLKQSRQINNIYEIVQVAINRINDEIAINEQHVNIILQGDTEPLYVNGAIEYLFMMIEEPLRNAAAFSSDGGTVEVTIRHDDAHVIVIIEDHGPGIPEDDIPLVWDRFIQIDRDQYEQQGAGLGLSIVRESARIHGGDCTIESKLGMWTRITLELPLVQGEEDDDQG
jgi:two-component system, sensor histidine kinase and response regulator